MSRVVKSVAAGSWVGRFNVDEVDVFGVWNGLSMKKDG